MLGALWIASLQWQSRSDLRVGLLLDEAQTGLGRTVQVPEVPGLQMHSLLLEATHPICQCPSSLPASTNTVLRASPL